MGIALRYKRFRHGHGFGIHSPYAYRFVREVLNPGRKYAFYGYADIALIHDATPHTTLHRSQLRLLMRILAELQPRTIAVACDSPADAKLVERVAELACPNATITPDGDTLVCVGSATPAPAARHAVFFDRTNPAAAAMIAKMERGHVYNSSHSTIIVGHPHLPRQIFDIRY